MYFRTNEQHEKEFPYIEQVDTVDFIKFLIKHSSQREKEIVDNYEKLIEHMCERQDKLVEKNKEMSSKIHEYRRNNKAVRIQLIIFMILFFATAVVLGIMHIKYKAVDFEYMSCVSAVFGALLLTVYCTIDK